MASTNISYLWSETYNNIHSIKKFYDKYHSMSKQGKEMIQISIEKRRLKEIKIF
jgi:hypothetical protein